jgi:hypothetical protein
MTEFKHGEMVCNAGELFYVRVTSEGEQTFQPVTSSTAALNEKAILAILYPPMPKEPPSKTLTERLVYLISSDCWGLVDEAGYDVMELTPEKETWRLRHRDYKTYQQVLDYAPEVSYKLFRRLPLGTKVRDPKTYTLTHEDTGFTFNGERLAPNIKGRWKDYFQEVIELPTEHSLSNYKAVSPENLLWSKTLKSWVEKSFEGDYAKSLLTGEVLPTDAEWVKPFSKIGKLDKGGKDVKKLNKLPKGTILTDDSCDTWERKAEGLVFDPHLKLAEEPFYSFAKYMIEIPKL